jgi:hypothetical protein
MTSNGSVLETAPNPASTLPPPSPLPSAPASGLRSVRGERAREGDYRSLFPDLPPLVVPSESLVKLAAALTEESDTKDGDNPHIPAGYTYLGQFIAHDLTHDQTPHAGANPAAPRNLRTPALDLDCVYGHGPFWDAQFYARDGKGSFPIGTTQAAPDHHDRLVPSTKNDLPRDKQGFATIPDQRNDGHLILAQLHLVFMKAHNLLLKRHALSFSAARSVLVSHYNATVQNEFLRLLLDEEVYASLANGAPRFVKFDEADPFLPIEFSCAAFRLHTMVRGEYDYNAVFPDSRLKQLLDFTGLLNGGSLTPIPSSWVIDWRRFFPLDAGIVPNASRKLDGKLTDLLNRGDRSIPGFDRGLSERTLLRGSKMGLPSGQDIARAIGVDPIGPDQIGTGPDGAVAGELGLLEATPLWYYLMKEAAHFGGTKLGPVGSTLVGEVLFGLAGNAEPRADASIIPPGMKGLLEFVGEINPLGF